MGQPIYSSINKRFTLLHPPKTAGSSVASGLQVYDSHGNFTLRMDMAGSQWQYMKTAVTIRNPWDRALSWFWYSTAHKDYCGDFEKWVMAGMPTAWRFDSSAVKEYQPRWHHQEDWFELDGESVVGFILRFETLQKSWEGLLSFLGLGCRPLPHKVWKDRPRVDYRALWTPEMLEVADPFFGYFTGKYGYSFGDEPSVNSLVGV